MDIGILFPCCLGIALTNREMKTHALGPGPERKVLAEVRKGGCP